MSDRAPSVPQAGAVLTDANDAVAVSPEEVGLLMEAVFERYGLDFRRYSPGYLQRRVTRSMADQKCAAVADLRALVLRDPAGMEKLLGALTIHTTSMFRDPEFHAAIRAQVIPWLKTYPFVRIWVAGCSTGEEAYSLAILLHEEGLYPRCRIYATDFNEAILDRARAGIFPLPLMQEYAANYQAAGGERPFSDYYVDDGREAIVSAPLRERIVFAQHNLACDGSFNEFHAIFCRNVLIYFDRELQARAHDLMWKSLIHHGFLGLGSSESLTLSLHQDQYEEVPDAKRIYRKLNPRQPGPRHGQRQ